MRRAAKIDRNQPEIVKALRLAGASVAITSGLGDGFPDLVVAKGRTFMLEIKDPLQPPSKRRLTKDELHFGANWKGELHVIETAEQALELIQK